MKLDEIFTFENIYKAHKKCRNSKQHKGEVIRFEVNLSVTISDLIKNILNKKYKLGKYKQFMIYDPKERLIEALPYKDRVVLMCFCKNSLIPRIEKKLIYDNVACRVGKGQKLGMDRISHFLKKEYRRIGSNDFYYLKCDIKKYFPSINHDILLQKLKAIGFSKDEMWLIEKFVRDQPNNLDVGLAHGNQSSQWFALFYLNSVDRLIREKLKIKSYVRYMDDMILIHESKEYLQQCKVEIERLCNQELDLSLNKKTQIGKVSNGIDFIGFKHILSNSGKVIVKMRGSSKVRLKRNLKNILKLKERGIVDNEYVSVRKNAFFSHIKDTKESLNLKNKVNPKNISNLENVK